MDYFLTRTIGKNNTPYWCNQFGERATETEIALWDRIMVLESIIEDIQVDIELLKTDARRVDLWEKHLEIGGH